MIVSEAVLYSMWNCCVNLYRISIYLPHILSTFETPFIPLLCHNRSLIVILDLPCRRLALNTMDLSGLRIYPVVKPRTKGMIMSVLLRYLGKFGRKLYCSGSTQPELQCVGVAHQRLRLRSCGCPKPCRCSFCRVFLNN